MYITIFFLLQLPPPFVQILQSRQDFCLFVYHLKIKQVQKHVSQKRRILHKSFEGKWMPLENMRIYIMYVYVYMYYIYNIYIMLPDNLISRFYLSLLVQLAKQVMSLDWSGRWREIRMCGLLTECSTSLMAEFAQVILETFVQHLF